MTNTRQLFFPVGDILKELDQVLENKISFDVVTLVGEGEPTLYLGLGELIAGIKERTDKPVAVITNGALLCDSQVRTELSLADIILPTLDAYDEASFRAINRPHGSLRFEQVKEGLIRFSKEYKGKLWVEIMLMDGINDDDASLRKFAQLLSQLHYDRLYLNTPVRPPAESDVRPLAPEKMRHAVNVLGGIAIDLLASEGFHSDIRDDYEAVKSIIKRHPMNQHEIESFLAARGRKDVEQIFKRLKRDDSVEVITYKGYETYRLRPMGQISH
jgi:wyosine [tRNA(Phe)-imidazoG37] synthetase (radical SAM superfamily)